MSDSIDLGPAVAWLEPVLPLAFAGPVMLTLSMSATAVSIVNRWHTPGGSSEPLLSQSNEPAIEASFKPMPSGLFRAMLCLSVMTSGASALALMHGRLHMGPWPAFLGGPVVLCLLNLFALLKQGKGYFKGAKGEACLAALNVGANLISTAAIQWDASGHLDSKHVYLALRSGFAGNTMLMWIMRLGRSFFPDPAKGWRDQVKPAVYYGLSMLLRGIIIMGALDTEKDVLVADACMLLLPLMVLDRNLSRHPAVNCGLALVGNSMMHVVLMLLLKPDEDSAPRIYVEAASAAALLWQDTSASCHVSRAYAAVKRRLSACSGGASA